MEPLLTARFQSLDKLPLFATEQEIATALLGPGKVEHWQQIVPLLERRGLPTIDGLMGGRYTPAVRKFFDLDYRVGEDGRVAAAPHTPAELGSWRSKKNARQG
jgi:hypothetical protein